MLILYLDINEEFSLSFKDNNKYKEFKYGLKKIIDIEKFKCVYFHVFLQKPVGISATLKLNVFVYDANDNLVSDLCTEINCEPIYDKFSKGLILRGDDGSCMSPGKYTEKISFEDSNTVTYHFELVQKKRKGLFGFFR